MTESEKEKIKKGLMWSFKNAGKRASPHSAASSEIWIKRAQALQAAADCAKVFINLGELSQSEYDEMRGDLNDLFSDAGYSFTSRGEDNCPSFIEAETLCASARAALAQAIQNIDEIWEFQQEQQLSPKPR